MNSDSVVTVTEETPTRGGDKVICMLYVWCVYVSVYRQRSASVPSQRSVLLSVKLLKVLVRTLVRCVYPIIVF